MRQLSMAVVVAGMAALAAAQEPSPDPVQSGWRQTTPEAGKYLVEPGTKVPLALINSISTKNSARGDRIYLETVFPILVNGRVVIPPGSYVAGTVTEVKRPGRIRGRGELFVRFDSLTLPNGVTRDFRARIGSLDGRASEELDRAEGKVRSEGNKSGDARTVGEATAAGTSVGVIAGHAAGRSGMGAGVGAAAGATAGLVGVCCRAARTPCWPRVPPSRWFWTARCASKRMSWTSAAAPCRGRPAAAAAPSPNANSVRCRCRGGAGRNYR